MRQAAVTEFLCRIPLGRTGDKEPFLYGVQCGAAGEGCSGESPVNRMLGSDAAMFNAILGPCDYMDVMAPDWKSAQMNIVMKDKEVNVLQLIVRGLENL